MGKVRVSFSLDPDLREKFDRWIRARGYTNRSEAFRDMVRECQVEEAWAQASREVAAVVVLVYAHRTHNLSQSLVEEEHRHHHHVLARTHVHLDEENCLEVVLLRGPAKEIARLGNRLISRTGVKFGRLVPATTGKDLI